MSRIRYAAALIRGMIAGTTLLYGTSMSAKRSLKPKAAPPKSSKASAYETIGRTSDGIFVLKPKMAMSPLGKKVARLMASGQAMTSATGAVEVRTTPPPPRRRRGVLAN